MDPRLSYLKSRRRLRAVSLLHSVVEEPCISSDQTFFFANSVFHG
jgi:hypothetical protein